LFGGFAGAVNDFRETLPDLTVVVYAGKAQIFERQMPKPLNRLVDTDIAVFNLL